LVGTPGDRDTLDERLWQVRSMNQKKGRGDPDVLGVFHLDRSTPFPFT
jgi:hypothetical protein